MEGISTNEILFWKVYRNMIIRNLIFEQMVTMKLEYTSLECHYIGNRMKLSNVKSLSWYLKRKETKMELLKDRLINGCGNGSEDYLMITPDSIQFLLKDYNETTSITKDILPLLYKYKREQMNQVDLVLSSVLSNNLQAVKFVTEVLKAETTKQSLDTAINYFSIDIIEYLLSNRSEGCTLETLFKYRENHIFDKYLIGKPQLWNGQEEFIKFSDFVQYGTGVQEIMLANNMVKKECSLNELEEVFKVANSSGRLYTYENEKYQLVIKYLSKFYTDTEILSTPNIDSIKQLLILKIIMMKSTDEEWSTGIDIFNELINQYGMDIQFVINFIISVYHIIKLLQNKFELHESFSTFKWFIEIVSTIDQFEKLLKSWPYNFSGVNKFTISEKIEILSIIKNKFGVNNRMAFKTLPPFTGLTTFTQTKECFEMFGKDCDFGTELIQGFFFDHCIKYADTGSLLEILEYIESVPEVSYIFENGFGDMNDKTSSLYFKCNQNQDDICEFITTLCEKVPEFRFNSTSFITSLECQIKDRNTFFKVLSILKQFKIIITPVSINSIISKFVCKDEVLTYLLTQFNHLIIPQFIMELFRMSVNQSNIKLLDILMSTQIDHFKDITYKLNSILDFNLIKWFVKNQSLFDQLDFSEILDNILLDILEKRPSTTSSEINLFETIQFIVEYLIENGVYKKPTSKFKDIDGDYISYTAVKTTKEIYTSNCDKEHFVELCCKLFKLFHKHKSSFYWDDLSAQLSSFDQQTFENDEKYNQMIVDLLNYTKPLPIPVEKVVKQKQQNQPKKQQSKPKHQPQQSKPQYQPQPQQKLYQFKCETFKNNLNLLISYGKVKEAIEFIKETGSYRLPNRLESKYYEDIFTYCDFPTVRDFLMLDHYEVDDQVRMAIENGNIQAFEHLISDELEFMVQYTFYKKILHTLATRNNLPVIKYLLTHKYYQKYHNNEIINSLYELSFKLNDILLFNYLSLNFKNLITSTIKSTNIHFINNLNKNCI